MCQTIREVLDAHGGAVAMTKQEWRDTLMEESPEVRNCSSQVFEHISLGLRQHDMACSGLRGEVIMVDGRELFVPDGGVTVIYDVKKFSLSQARTKCEEDGLSTLAQEYFEQFEGVSA